MAQRENLPIAVVFLGGDRCPWSQKLSQDVLNDAYFVDRVGSNAILWTVALDEKSQGRTLAQKYGVEEYPQILLLDPKGKEFARFGYLPLNAMGYLDEIAHLIDHFQEICIAMEQKEEAFHEERWTELYLKAKKFSSPYFKQMILDRGFKKEKGNFFHLEKFANALLKHQRKNPQVSKLKTELLKRDPENKCGIHFKVAVLEFQKNASKFKTKGRPEKAIKPLLLYTKRFGKQDIENFWKAERAIAEFLFEKKSIPLALEHIEQAYHAAPEAMKPEIAETILYMKRN